MSNSLLNVIESKKLIVIVRGIEAEKIISLAEALYNGGIRLMEITYSANSSVSDEKTADNIAMLTSHFGDRMHIGAGTVLTEKQVELTYKNGGKFIISPDTNAAVIKKTKELGLVSIPGALTPTEIQAAHSAGADFVKIFPITSLGAEYIKAVKAPLSHIKMLAVGGINERNIPDYLKAGICGFGIGSNIISKKLIDENKFDEITSLAEKYFSVVNGIE